MAKQRTVYTALTHRLPCSLTFAHPMHIAESIFQQLDTSSLALEQLVYESGQQIPGSVHYTIKRFAKPSGWMSEDVGVFRYHFEPRQPEKNHLELRFCITGNMYCRQYQDECNRCPLHETINCHAQVESLDVFNFVFTSTLLSQFVKSRFSEGKLTEEVMAFKYPASFIKKLPLCSKTVWYWMGCSVTTLPIRWRTYISTLKHRCCCCTAWIV